MARQLEIILQCTDDDSAPVPLPSLLRTLGAVQTMALQIGQMLAGHVTVPTRGEFAAPIRDACEFRVRKLNAGSPAYALLELLPVAQQALFEECGDGDLGERSIDTILRIADEVANGVSWEAVADLLPAQSHRRLILNTYRRFCPTRSERQWVSIGSPGVPRRARRLTSEHRARVQMLGAKDTEADEVEERQLIGRLNMLQGEPPQLEISQEGDRAFACPYDHEELGEQLRDMWDRTVIAMGICRVIKHEHADDEIVELRGIVEITVAPMEPLRITEVVTDASTLPLQEAIEVAPDFSDNLVSFEYQPLDILAYGQTREEAEAAFREELNWLWEAYALAQDETLDRNAQELKATLLSLVRGEDG